MYSSTNFRVVLLSFYVGHLSTCINFRITSFLIAPNSFLSCFSYSIFRMISLVNLRLFSYSLSIDIALLFQPTLRIIFPIVAVNSLVDNASLFCIALVVGNSRISSHILFISLAALHVFFRA